MLNRRDLVLAAVAAALARPSVTAASPGGGRLDALLTTFINDELDRSPETITQLGLDKGDRAAAKSKLDQRSLDARAKDKADNLRRLGQLRALDRRAMSGRDAVNYDTMDFVLRVQADADRRFAFGDMPGSPYMISQLSGAYQEVPDFLATQHAIETSADAEAYLERLAAFATVMDQEIEKARHDAAAGAVPPDFAIDKAIVQMSALRRQPAEGASLVQSLVRRAHENGIAGDWNGRAARIYEGRVRPALDRQIALMRDFRIHATHDAGVWKLPGGKAYYDASLEYWTTTATPPAEAHQTGLDLVASLSAELDQRLKAQGLTNGSIGQRLRALFDDPSRRYPNTDAGKAQLLADLNAKVRLVQAKLPAWFGTLPKAQVEIRRVPLYLEAAAAGGYYEAGSLDGGRPGAFYINLRDTAEVPSWILPSLTYHEAIPGHHLQLSLQQQADLPLIRKVVWFSAYGEGWALYAEQLAAEMGMYKDDPLGRIGYLHDAMFRAVRLVVDTGLHHMRWSREQAIRYYVDTLGDPEASATTEVERYCVWPGQAFSYMIGKLAWLRLRARAKAALGDRFDIRAFHDAGLSPGATPLTVLDGLIADYTRARMA
jgi:uncharacterized protein (DUF885 family)